MPSSSSISKLRSVFGALDHAPPEPAKGDVEVQKKAEAEAAAYVPEDLPKSPAYDKKTGVLMMPSKRFDGSTEDPPWNVPEPILWDWLRTTEVERIDDSIFSGINGTLWAIYRDYDGNERGALLRFAGVSRDHAIEHWGSEYSLSNSYDLLKREQAAYEVMKALGCEDIAPPLVAKEIDLGPLIPKASRSAIGEEGAIGGISLLQSVPTNAENFAEHWAKLGPDDTNRWERASDRLRHSIYRAILVDFILGVPNRTLCDYMYQRSLDSLAVYGFEVSFPHPGLTAEWYLAMRKKGWGRKFSGPLEEPMAVVPAGGVDSFGMMATFTDAQRDEMVFTAKQVVKGFDPQTATLLIQVLDEIGVPPACIAGMVSKIVFLENDAEDILDNSFDYVRSVVVPLRRGYGMEEGRIQAITQTTSEIMTTALGKKFDFAKVVQEPVPKGVQFTV